MFLQNAGLLDFYIGCYCSQQPGHLEPVVLDVLRLGAYQILFMDRVPDSAAVSESVELVKRSGKERAAGMVNAVLRKISANREHLPEIPGRNRAEYLSVRYSHPLWLVQRCLTLLGKEEAEAFALQQRGGGNCHPVESIARHRRSAAESAPGSRGADLLPSMVVGLL